MDLIGLYLLKQAIVFGDYHALFLGRSYVILFFTMQVWGTSSRSPVPPAGSWGVQIEILFQTTHYNSFSVFTKHRAHFV